MRRKVVLIVPWVLAAGFAVAFFARRSSGPPPKPPTGPAGRRVLYWTDPMVPGYKSDKPGKSPFMDMQLVPVYEDSAASPSAAPGSVAGYTAIQLSPERQQLIGVAVGRAEMKDLSRTIRAVGRVSIDETQLNHIHAKFEGYVEKLFADYTGKTVRRGEPLLSIYSPDLLSTEQEYLTAYGARQQFRASGNPELARRGEELYDAARQRLLLWDIPAAEIERLERSGEAQKALTLYSPVDGVIVAKSAVQGNRVMPGDNLFDVADLSRIWVLADVYEYELPFVLVGQEATMTLAYLPGRSWRGKVAFLSPVLDEKTRTVKVRLEFANPDGVLKPEMFANVILQQPLGSVLTVPEDAVLLTGRRALVFLATGGGHFEPREVEIGARSDGSYQILKGLAPGDLVVTQANFLIDSESRLKAALEGMKARP
jgi:RND family efflux transporter MFP subunit